MLRGGEAGSGSPSKRRIVTGKGWTTGHGNVGWEVSKAAQGRGSEAYKQ